MEVEGGEVYPLGGPWEEKVPPLLALPSSLGRLNLFGLRCGPAEILSVGRDKAAAGVVHQRAGDDGWGRGGGGCPPGMEK